MLVAAVMGSPALTRPCSKMWGRFLESELNDYCRLQRTLFRKTNSEGYCSEKESINFGSAAIAVAAECLLCVENADIHSADCRSRSANT